MPLKLKQSLKSLSENGLERKCNTFSKNTIDFYEMGIDYLQKWISPLKEFEHLQLIKLQNIKDIKFDEIILYLEYHESKVVTLDDSKPDMLVIKIIINLCILAKTSDSSKAFG